MPIRVQNVQQGFVDSNGIFRPIRASADYDESRTAVGKAKAKKAARKAAAQKAAKTRAANRRKKTGLAVKGRKGAVGRKKIVGRKSNPLDVTQRELLLFIENDGNLYRQMHTPINKNLANKIASGKYNKTLALKAFVNLATEGAKRYAKEFSIDPREWHSTFSVADRKAVAAELLKSFEDEYAAGEFVGMLHKKYQKKGNPRSEYEVVVGNIGTAYRGSSLTEAKRVHALYVQQSSRSMGRAAGEDVTTFKNGEPIKEYFGHNSLEEDF